MAKVAEKAKGEAKSRRLTEKQDKFCRELMKTGSQYEAYCAAYKTENMQRSSIDGAAWALMQDPKITRRIEELKERVVQKAVLTREMVINGLIENFTSAAAIADYTASNKALELLGKVDELGLFVERKQVESDNRHHHSEEPVSPLVQHLEEIIGIDAESAPAGTLPN